ncbi:hypothetical protein BpHYR1_024481, partial [Brachionus plicatilis]
LRSILKLKYDTPSNILHQEAYNKLKLLTISNRLCELSERYIKAGLINFVPLVLRLVKNIKQTSNQDISNIQLHCIAKNFYCLKMKI